MSGARGCWSSQRAGDLAQDMDPQAAAWCVLSLLASHHFRAAVLLDRKNLEKKASELVLKGLVG